MIFVLRCPFLSLHQALWRNLTSILKGLLSTCELPPEESISICIAIAGNLVDQANTSRKQLDTSPLHSSAMAATNGSTAPMKPAVAGDTVHRAGDGQAAALASVELLELAVELLDHGRKQAEALRQQQSQRDPAALLAEDGKSVVDQVSDIQQQVRWRQDDK
jgi:hypothetical protein